MSNIVDKELLSTYFRNPCQTIRTSGTRDGIILKFKTFYLKIYDEYEDSYSVEVYRYWSNEPLSIDKVHVSKMREYAFQFNDWI